MTCLPRSVCLGPFDYVVKNYALKPNERIEIRQREHGDLWLIVYEENIMKYQSILNDDIKISYDKETERFYIKTTEKPQFDVHKFEREP